MHIRNFKNTSTYLSHVNVNAIIFNETVLCCTIRNAFQKIKSWYLAPQYTPIAAHSRTTSLHRSCKKKRRHAWIWPNTINDPSPTITSRFNVSNFPKQNRQKHKPISREKRTRTEISTIRDSSGINLHANSANFGSFKIRIPSRFACKL